MHTARPGIRRRSSRPFSRRSLLSLLVLTLVLSACGGGTSSSSSSVPPLRDHQALPDYWPTTSWQSAAPELHGVADGAFDALATQLAEDLPYATSLMIVRDGYVLHETYQTPSSVGDTVTAATLHNIWSVTKSVASLTVGAAVQQGDVQMVELDTRAGDVFAPQMADLAMDDPRRDIRLRDTLHMQSGLQWNEPRDLVSVRNPLIFPDTDCVNDDTRLLCSILHFDAAFEPGTVWNYSTNDSYLTAAFLYALTDWSMRDYADAYLFTPLGIEFDVEQWINAPQTATNNAYTYGGGLSALTTPDLMKLGMLTLYDGYWDGQQVVSEGWIDAMQTPIGDGLVATFDEDGDMDVPASEDVAYGFQWWLASDTRFNSFDGVEAISARGLGGQYIMVYPQQGLVAVVTCAYSLGSDVSGRDTEILSFLKTRVLDQLVD